MPAISPRAVFVLSLVIQFLLWSQSHYGHVQQLHESQSLVKRISHELTNSGNALAEVKECRPKLIPIDSQCSHVQKSCHKSGTFLSFSYLHQYFCTDVNVRPAIFIGLIVWLVFLFSTLGITASDFFTPNLATIAQVLGLDENVAGVTFLAFGNGSPDVFSTFSAMRANSGSLAIGELLGAATFIVSCVVGSMCIIKPFQVVRGPFLRDVGFFTIAVGLTVFILFDGWIHWYETGLMIALYLIYVVVVVVGSWWEKRRQRRRAREALIRSEYQDDDSRVFLDVPYQDDPSPTILPPPSASPPRTRAVSAPGPPPRINTIDLPRRYVRSRTPSPTPQSPSSYQHLPSFSLVGALEFREVIASLRNEASASSLSIFDTPVTPYAGGHYHSHSHSRSRPRTPPGRDVDPWDATLSVPLNDRSPNQLPQHPQQPQILLTPALSDVPERPTGEDLDHVDRLPPSMMGSIPSLTHTPASPTTSEGGGEGDYFPKRTRRQRAFRLMSDISHTIFPSLYNFRKQSILGQIAGVFAVPAIFLLTLTLPVVVTPYEHSHNEKRQLGNDHSLIDFEEEGVERTLIAEDEVQEELHGVGFNKWLTAAQCLFAPLFCVAVLFNGTKHELWLLVAALIAGIAMGILVLTFAGRGNHPTFQMARCSMGFFVAIVWIMAIADEVVLVLQTFGFIFGLSDAIIGLTVFAVGNSLADLVANMSVAVFAPVMGFSACFGGPMLNILLGVGVAGSYIIAQTGKPYPLTLSRTLMVSGFGLLALLATTLVFVPWNGYFLTRSWGIFLIATYVSIMVVNIVVELKS